MDCPTWRDYSSLDVIIILSFLLSFRWFDLFFLYRLRLLGRPPIEYETEGENTEKEEVREKDEARDPEKEDPTSIELDHSSNGMFYIVAILSMIWTQ